MDREIIEFIEFSRLIGKSLYHVQGGGGNCSLKLGDKMYVKASGTLLKDIHSLDQLCCIDFNKVNILLEKFNHNNNEFDNRIKEMSENGFKPSIETGFHSILGKFVLHTHSVYANTLNCSSQGKQMISKIFPQAILVDYALPGLEVSQKILQMVKELKFPNSGIIFLENHGLICWSEKVNDLINLYNNVHDEIKKNLNFFKEINIKNETQLPNPTIKECLFPDQVVFADHELNSRSKVENIFAYSEIIKNINLNNYDPKFLSLSDCNQILNLDSEKFRQKLSK